MNNAIIRLERFKKGTISQFLIDGEMFCVILENPWINNEPNISCIPVGHYKCRRVRSRLVERLTKGKWKETFEILDVKGRTLIRFHQGCFPRNTKGCPLMGSHPGKLRTKTIKERAILNSGKTFDRFMTRMEGINEFDLSIISIEV